MNLKMYLWVTSNCNFSCPNCNQKYGLSQNRGYDMGMDELSYFISSSKARGVHYYMIELTGGEPTLWSCFEDGVKLLFNSNVCDKITLVTNGNSPSRIISLSSMIDYWIVSKTQATEEQVREHSTFPSKVFWNDIPHRKFPTYPDRSKLPAICCCTVDKYGKDYNGLLYLKNKIYYCILAPSMAEWVDLPKEHLICNFDEDFVGKFTEKKYDKLICAYCMCNNRIWEKYD